MSTENLDVICRGYEAFGRGDVTTVLGILDPSIQWHVPGRSPLSGDYKGHDEVIYKDALVVELNRAGIPFSREKNYEITYKAVLRPKPSKN